MVTSIVNPKMSEIFESNRLVVQAGSNENPTPAAPAVTIAPTIGVRKPIKSRTPAAKAKKPMNHDGGVGLASSI